MIQKLFLQYGYKDFQHRRQFVDTKKLAKEYEKKLLGEKYHYLLKENGNIVGVTSMHHFKSLSKIWNKKVYFLRDFVVDQKTDNISDNYKRLFNCFFDKYKKDIDFLITKQPTDNYRAVNSLLEKGFYYVCDEVIYTLDLEKDSRDYNAGSKNTCIRFAKKSDLDSLKKMVYGNHKFNRYLFDPTFSPSDVIKLYERVIEQSYHNPHHSIYVYEIKGKIVGFLTTIYNEQISYMMNNQYGSFDYIIVDERYQRAGIGSVLMDRALADFKKKGIRIISVKTMANNYPSIRLLIKDGFFITSQNIILHFRKHIT